MSRYDTPSAARAAELLAKALAEADQTLTWHLPKDVGYGPRPRLIITLNRSVKRGTTWGFTLRFIGVDGPARRRLPGVPLAVMDELCRSPSPFIEHVASRGPEGSTMKVGRTRGKHETMSLVWTLPEGEANTVENVVALAAPCWHAAKAGLDELFPPEGLK